MPAIPANHIGSQLPQAFEGNSSPAQIPLGDRSTAAPPTVHNPPQGPVKRLRTGTTKMRPSKSSTTQGGVLYSTLWAILTIF